MGNPALLSRVLNSLSLLYRLISLTTVLFLLLLFGAVGHLTTSCHAHSPGFNRLVLQKLSVASHTCNPRTWEVETRL